MESSRRSTDPPRAPLAPDLTRRRLSARELEIALLVAEGLKDFLIARRLGLSTSTVGTHVRRIQSRLGLDDRAGIIAWVEARRSPAYRRPACVVERPSMRPDPARPATHPRPAGRSGARMATGRCRWRDESVPATRN